MPFTTNPRNQWYDRNPVARRSVYAALNGPSVATQRWSYTVPSGKKFALQTAECLVNRKTVAGTPETVQNYINYSPSGSGQDSFLVSLITDNVVGSKDRGSIAGTVVLLEGDALTAFTSDASTGGTHWDFITMQGLEFDE